MKKGNLDSRTLELRESARKEQKRKNKMVAALLMASLAIGFCIGMRAMHEIKVADLATATAGAEIQRQQALEYQDRLIETQTQPATVTTEAEMQHQQALEYQDRLIETQTQLATVTTEAEMQHQQALEYQDRLIETQMQLDELRTKPPEIVTIDVPVIVEVEKKIPQELREFEDLAELKEWLEENKLRIVLRVGKDGTVALRGPKSTSQYDCDDYAEALQRKALEQGFLMSQQLVSNGKIFGVKVSESSEPHMGNLTIIGNDIYYVESQPPHNVVRITNRD